MGTKDDVDPAIPSVLLVPSKVNGRRTMEVSPTCPNNNMSTAPDVTVTMDAKEVGTNPAGGTPRMPAVTRVRAATVSTTLSLLLDTEAKVAETTSWSRTR